MRVYECTNDICHRRPCQPRATDLSLSLSAHNEDNITYVYGSNLQITMSEVADGILGEVETL